MHEYLSQWLDFLASDGRLPLTAGLLILLAVIVGTLVFFISRAEELEKALEASDKKRESLLLRLEKAESKFASLKARIAGAVQD